MKKIALLVAVLLMVNTLAFAAHPHKKAAVHHGKKVAMKHKASHKVANAKSHKVASKNSHKNLHKVANKHKNMKVAKSKTKAAQKVAKAKPVEKTFEAVQKPVTPAVPEANQTPITDTAMKAITGNEGAQSLEQPKAKSVVSTARMDDTKKPVKVEID